MAWPGLSYAGALELIAGHCRPGRIIAPGLEASAGLCAAEDIIARTPWPSHDISRKMGYAVFGTDTLGAAPGQPVDLELSAEGGVAPGRAAPVQNGQRLPAGSDAVLSAEFAAVSQDRLQCLRPAEPGRNVLARSGQVAAGQVVLEAGREITPAAMGLLAAAGVERPRVFARPRLGLLSLGRATDSAPQLAMSSNLLTLAAWCARLGLECRGVKCGNRPGEAGQALEELASGCEMVIISGAAAGPDPGGAGQLLASLGAETVFAGVALGPGKGSGLGLYGKIPLFVLPGTPVALESAFLALAMPGLAAMRVAGAELPRLRLRSLADIKADPEFSQIRRGVLRREGSFAGFLPLPQNAGLAALAASNAMAILPPSRRGIPAGGELEVMAL